MAVSTTSFSERLTRLDPHKIKLYAGDGAPQAYAPGKLIAKQQKKQKLSLASLAIGTGLGTVVGYLFQTNVGIEMFFSQPLSVLFSIIKGTQSTAAICLAMAAGPLCALGFQMFSLTKSRLAQFWWAYVCGTVGVNATAWYQFYLSFTS